MPKKILLVEDHDSTRLVTARLLQRLGHQVSPASTVAGALSLAESDFPEVLLSDLHLPDGDGCDLMQKLALQGRVIGIAVSGANSSEDKFKARQVGFQHFLVKPIDWDRLRTLLEAL